MKPNCFYIITDRFGNKSGGYTSHQEVHDWAVELSKSRGDYQPGSYQSSIDYLKSIFDHFSIYYSKQEFLHVAREELLLQDSLIAI